MNHTLIECSDCGREISRRSDKCVHCGAPNSITALYQNESEGAEREKNGSMSAILMKWSGSILVLYGVLVVMKIVLPVNHPDSNVIIGCIVFLAATIFPLALARAIYLFFKNF